MVDQKYVRAWRERQARAGMRQINVWVHASDVVRVRRYVKKINGEGKSK